jgi:DNA-binding MarR family transcriptional regulator
MAKKKRRPLDKHDYEVLAALRYALRQFLRFSEEAAHTAGLTPQQHQALLAIKGFPKRDFVTVGELAERLQVLHHSAVGLADRLVKQKLLRRARNPDDHRQVYVTLTAGGQNVLHKLSAEHREQLHRIGPEINAVLRRLKGKTTKERT